MVKVKLLFYILLCSITLTAQNKLPDADSIVPYLNYWTKPPAHIPNDVSIDAPLMGNGDVTMSVGYSGDSLRYYLSKNDFWRLKSQADGLSGPRVVGFVDVQIEGFNEADFSASQMIRNGVVSCVFDKNSRKMEAKSWVSATENLVFIELTAIQQAVKVSVKLCAPKNERAKLTNGKAGSVYWQVRTFTDSVDVPSEVAVALKTINYSGNTIEILPGKKLLIIVAIGSKFKVKDPLDNVLSRMMNIDKSTVSSLFELHNKWWDKYWGKSSVTVEDSVLMKAYYQGLYTMAACSRDRKFPAGIFGWTTTDTPGWNGDYHLNYNFQAPFYGLYSSNRLEQGETQDAPLLDFMLRGEWYAKNVTHTRGILYPVGIGPLGIETTRNFQKYANSDNFEKGGLFFGQRSNAVYGLINMAQQWRCTYNTAYGMKIYPYALAVTNFWEDYLKFENGRYVIYGDAIHEGSGKDKNPILSLGLIRNAFDLILDLSSTLKLDEDRQAKWKDILSKLSDFPIQTRNGRSVFRYTEEGVAWWDGNGLGIQHIYPGNAVNLDSNAKLLEIARNTIDEMQRWQDTNTSNSFFAAAVRVGYNPSIILNELRKYALHTYPNGFQLNNPHGIENSCTVANALNEMLCMSAGNVIRLFSVFPENQNAEFKNVRTWGAFLVSAKLINGSISDVEIFSEQGKPCTIVNPWLNKKVQLKRNGKSAEILEGERISFKTSMNEALELKQF